jgi:hypothetical protein
MLFLGVESPFSLNEEIRWARLLRNLVQVHMLITGSEHQVHQYKTPSSLHDR